MTFRNFLTLACRLLAGLWSDFCALENQAQPYSGLEQHRTMFDASGLPTTDPGAAQFYRV